MVNTVRSDARRESGARRTGGLRGVHWDGDRMTNVITGEKKDGMKGFAL